MTYENNDYFWVSCCNYIKFPSFLIHYVTPFFIWSVILELTSRLTFIPVIFQFRTSLWVNEISQVIFWPLFLLSYFLVDLSVRDFKLIPKENRSIYIRFLFLIPVCILAIEPIFFLSETILLIPDDFPQTRVSEQKYQSVKSEIVLVSLTFSPLSIPLSKYLKDRKMKSLHIQIKEHNEINFDRFFPMMWMSFIVPLSCVFIYNFQTFH